MRHFHLYCKIRFIKCEEHSKILIEKDHCTMDRKHELVHYIKSVTIVIGSKFANCAGTS